MQAFITGFILALGLIIPLGVQNIFVFNQGILQRQWLHSMPSMMTAFFCDVVLILLAILGISKMVISVPEVLSTLYALGFIFLMYMGWSTWTTPMKLDDKIKPLSAQQQIYFAMSVSLLNPHALIDTVVVIGTNSANFNGADKYLYTMACVFVSFSWFLGLSLLGYFIKKKDVFGWCRVWLNKISALFIWGAALYIAAQWLK